MKERIEERLHQLAVRVSAWSLTNVGIVVILLLVFLALAFLGLGGYDTCMAGGPNACDR